MKKTIRKYKWKICVISAFLTLFSPFAVLAGGINANEQRLIDEASGEFTYDGKTYRAKKMYLDQLREKLSEDDMDLSEEQVSQLLSTMYASVYDGVEQGILEEIESGESEAQEDATEEPTVHKDAGTGDNVQKTGADMTEGTVYTEQEGVPSSDGQTERQVKEEQETTGKAQQTESISEIETVQKETEKGRAKETPVSEKAVANRHGEEATEQETAVFENKTGSVLPGEKETVPAKTDAGNSLRLPGIMIGTVFLIACVMGLYRKNKKKRRVGKLAADIGCITDVHCHILPGVDDGSRDMDMTMDMLEKAYQQGVRRVIATPHYHIGQVQNSPEKLKSVLTEVREQAKKKYPDLEIGLGNEIFYSDGVVEELNKGHILTMMESKYVLVEFLPEATFHYIHDAVMKLMRAGYMPIIAHVERYACMKGQDSYFEELHELGVLFQVNYNSIERSRYLFKNGFVDLLATDCHDNQIRVPRIRENLKDLFGCCEEQQIKDILKTNPDKLWNHGKGKER